MNLCCCGKSDIVDDRLNETIILRTEGELKLFSRIPARPAGGNPDEERIGKIGVRSRE
ncbi:MAG: hypothetical protein KAW86_02490 [Bacteroidales bacterium]|nr:hypothetical protein [Bacteroidales bacterium]